MIFRCKSYYNKYFTKVHKGIIIFANFFKLSVIKFCNMECIKLLGVRQLTDFLGFPLFGYLIYGFPFLINHLFFYTFLCNVLLSMFYHCSFFLFFCLHKYFGQKPCDSWLFFFFFFYFNVCTLLHIFPVVKPTLFLLFYRYTNGETCHSLIITSKGMFFFPDDNSIGYTTPHTNRQTNRPT